MGNGIFRSDYLRSHLAEVKRALDKGVPVRGYNFWSITSNCEWGHAEGYFQPRDFSTGSFAAGQPALHQERLFKRA